MTFVPRVPKLRSRRPGDRAVAEVEAEAAVRVSDEVEHSEAVLLARPPKAATELLKKHRCALRRAKKENGIDFRYVDTLIEEVDGEETVHIAAPLSGCSPSWTFTRPSERSSSRLRPNGVRTKGATREPPPKRSIRTSFSLARPMGRFPDIRKLPVAPG
jgi:hypothetical protein